MFSSGYGNLVEINFYMLIDPLNSFDLFLGYLIFLLSFFSYQIIYLDVSHL